jgi:tetratricopeptide (TPR) repeat protein
MLEYEEEKEEMNLMKCYSKRFLDHINESKELYEQLFTNDSLGGSKVVWDNLQSSYKQSSFNYAKIKSGMKAANSLQHYLKFIEAMQKEWRNQTINSDKEELLNLIEYVSTYAMDHCCATQSEELSSKFILFIDEIASDKIGFKYCRARHFEILGKLDESQKDYEAILSQSPGHMSSRINFANILMKKKDNYEENIERAFVVLSCISKECSDNPQLLYSLGGLYEKCGDIERANEYYTYASTAIEKSTLIPLSSIPLIFE